MRWRSAHLWLLGPLLFGPSILIWTLSIWIAGVGEGWRSFDAYSVQHLHLPMLAAILGFSAPLFALRACWDARRKSTFIAMLLFWLIMLSWGFLDVRHGYYQIGVHYHGATPAGHRGYSHYYHTWWFIPYYWIER